jgi:glycine C-acetyltransferase
VGKFIESIQAELDELQRSGKYKEFSAISGPMGPVVRLADGREVVNLCSNNYLGLADHPEVIRGAKEAMDRYGFGTSSVRFICGTLAIHQELENVIADFCGQEKATTYVSCWNANEALLPTLLGEGDVVISDELNHASIIDSCRLCAKSVQRLVYRHSDMSDLEAKLKETAKARRKLIITDGVFSMEGDLANLPEIVDLAHRYDALVAVDDSHAHGVVGRTGRGTPEHFHVKVDIVTGTLGKALGGAAGGFIASTKPIIEFLTQRSRPQLFSNSLPPAVAGGALAAIKILEKEPQRVSYIQENVNYLRSGLLKMKFNVLPSASAILPIIVGETAEAIRQARAMLDQGVLITGFGYPVVPEGKARLRIQVTAVHTRNHLDKVLNVFETIKQSKSRMPVSV